MSPSYAAPEVIEGRFSQWSDQYSLAVTYCQLRTGRPPFVGESAIQIIYAHVHTAPDLSGLPEAERPVVARALAKRPEERWPTCGEFTSPPAGGIQTGDGWRSPCVGHGLPRPWRHSRASAAALFLSTQPWDAGPC